MSTQPYNTRSWERTYKIYLDAATKRSLWSRMKQELHYYNTLVNELNSKIRVFPSEISEIKDQYEKLWIAVAQSETDPRSLVDKPLDTWPEQLKPFSDIIVRDGKPAMNDRKMLLYSIPATKADIHPLVRRSIALEILKWIQPAAKSIAQSNSNNNGQMNGPLQMLQPMSIESKRHVQLLGNSIDITYDPERRTTNVKIPYSEKTIEIPLQDLTTSAVENVIIRQTPNQLVDETSPWQITIKNGSGRYLLDLVDMTHKPKIRKKNKRFDSMR